MERSTMFYTLDVSIEDGKFPLSLLVTGMTLDRSEMVDYEFTVPYMDSGEVDFESLLCEVASQLIVEGSIEFKFYLVYDSQEGLNYPYSELVEALENLLGVCDGN